MKKPIALFLSLLSLIVAATPLHGEEPYAKDITEWNLRNPDLPEITEGRIGLRHMFTRAARYGNFRVSVPGK